MSASTVHRSLAAENMHQWKARSVVFLTQAQEGARIQWAKDHKDWSMKDWSRVVYSDEGYVVLGNNKGMVYITWSLEQVYDDNCVAPKFKQSLSE